MQLPTIWTDGKAQPGRSSAMEKVRSEKSEIKQIRQDEKVGKSRNTVFFPMAFFQRFGFLPV